MDDMVRGFGTKFIVANAIFENQKKKKIQINRI